MTATAAPAPSGIVYPESDGKPMAESTRQFDWILKLVGNLKILYRERADVFVAGNQFWYPVQGHPEIVQAPDGYVVFGRPKGFRSSYRQWEEGNVPMTIVFEVRSPSNTIGEMADKLEWYSEHKVEEYYDYDPETNHLIVYERHGNTLVGVDPAHGHVSHRLGIRFDLSGDELVVYYPDGRPFLSVEELGEAVETLGETVEELRDQLQEEQQSRQDAIKQVADERGRADRETQRADDAGKRADDAQRRAVRLAELTQKALQQQATAEEQDELRTLMAALLAS